MQGQLIQSELQWFPNPTVSALHAGDLLVRGKTLVDPKMVAALEEPAQLLQREISVTGLDPRRFWNQLLANAGSFPFNQELVKVCLLKARGPMEPEVASGRIDDLANRISALELAMKRACPDLEEDLQLRLRPLKEQWEARGPGLLRMIGAVSEEGLIPSSAKVYVVPPALGGGGMAHLMNNSLRIEGVLANPVAELPEVVRLGWLLAQLNLDIPLFSDGIHARRLPHIAKLAMLPPTLVAAQQVELASFDPLVLETAIEAWHISQPEGLDLVDTLLNWWATYEEARPEWYVALRALDQMIG